MLIGELIPNRSDKGSRRGSFLGTITGRVVKESYGATRQQHTFTVSLGKIKEYSSGVTFVIFHKLVHNLVREHCVSHLAVIMFVNNK